MLKTVVKSSPNDLRKSSWKWSLNLRPARSFANRPVYTVFRDSYNPHLHGHWRVENTADHLLDNHQSNHQPGQIQCANLSKSIFYRGKGKAWRDWIGVFVVVEEMSSSKVPGFSTALFAGVSSRRKTVMQMAIMLVTSANQIGAANTLYIKLKQVHIRRTRIDVQLYVRRDNVHAWIGQTGES